MLPESLVRFGDNLEQAIARDLRAPQRQRRTRVAIRLATAGAVCMAVAVGAVSISRDGTPVVGPSAVEPAEAATRASAVLDPGPGRIVHAAVAYRQVDADGAASAWREETWRATSAPYARRTITVGSDGARTETSQAGERPAALYDAATDTIYTQPPSGGPALGTPAPAADGDPLRAQLAELLRSGDARRVTNATSDGRAVVRFVYDNVWPGGEVVRFGYVVDADSYVPLRITTTSPDGSRTVARFETYETLPADASSRPLLSVREQHPDASVDRTASGYAAAMARLTAHP